MGRNSSEIQHDLERQRNALEARIQRLNERVRDDVSSAGEELRATVSEATAPGSAVAEHPKALISGAAGAGAVLGLLSAGVSLRGHRRSDTGERRRQSASPSRKPAYGPYPVDQSSSGADGGDSRTRRVLSAATGAAAGSLQGQLNELVTETWNSFKSGFKSDSRKRSTEDQRVAPFADVLVPRATRATRSNGSPVGSGNTRYLNREEIQPMDTKRKAGETDADLHRREDEEARKTIHEAEVEDLNPRQDAAVAYGVQGEGALISPTPGTGGVPGERPSERRSGQ